MMLQKQIKKVVYKTANASPPRSWIKHTKWQPCAPMYGRLYHYAGNNPVRYTDLDGRETTQKDFYWNGQYVSTTTVSTKTTTHYFSVNELNNFISDIQKSKSHKNIMDKHIYEKAKDAFGFTSLTTSIIEPVVKSTFKEIADAYLYIFLQLQI